MSLKETLNDYDIQLDDNQIDLLLKYMDLVLEKNKVMNLTAITEEEMFHVKHFVDSLYVLNLFDFEENKTIIDVGTGAGFPAIPIKIARDDLKFTLLDSLRKRVDFLKDVIDELHLTDIKAVHERAEECTRTAEYREQYDYCISRAVSKLDTLAEFCLPFVKVGGYMIAMKGKSDETDVGENAIKILGGKIEQTIDYKIDDEDRSLVVIKKIKETPKKYPRGGGKPKKNPL